MRKITTIFTVALVLTACSEQDRPDNFEPLLYAEDAENVTRKEATVNGRIVVLGNTPLPELTFIYGTGTDMTLSSSAVTPDADGHVQARLTGLKGGTHYRFCLQGNNGRVILTSDTLAFTTLPNEKPTLYVDTATDVTRSEATLAGGVVKEEDTPTPELEFVYSAQGDAQPVRQAVEADDEGRVSLRLTGLEMGTSYSFCLQGHTGDYILSSDTLTFTTQPEDIPQLHIDEATNVTRHEATLAGKVTKEEDTPMPELEFVYSTQGDAQPVRQSVEADGEGRVSLQLTGLKSGTSYSFCLQGHAGDSILSSDTLTFATQPDEPPTVGHPALVSLGPASAIVSYEILSEGSEKLTETGCYVRQLPTGHSTKVTAAATTGICQLHIGGLECNSTYQIQPYAASPVGEAKGGTLEITTTDAVTWDEPGGLSALMGEDLYRFASLSFAGPMNGDDLRLLRQMMGRNADGSASGGQLSHVNLADADIVSGGGSYDNSRYSQDHVVGQGLFAGCDRLEEVVLPYSTTTVEKDAFLDCGSLVRLTLPAYTEEVVPSDGCTRLAEINIPTTNTHYRSIDGVLFDAAGSEITWFPMGKSGDYVLPSSITSIGDYAFRNCRLTKITLPEGFKELGQGAFCGSSLEEVVAPSTLRTVPTAAFQACSRLKTVRLGSGTELISDYAFDGCPLEHLYIEAPYPPLCNPDAFTTSQADLFSTCVLHVPANRVNMYKADPEWGQFENITGIE